MKGSNLLIAPMMDLKTIPETDRAVVRKFLFECIRGLDAKHDKRWRRLWGRIWKSEPGEATQLVSLVPRSRKFHARHMAIENRLFEAQDRFDLLEGLRNWLKTGAAFGEYHLVGTRMKFVPSSLAYDQCSNDQMHEFHDNAIAYLHTPRAQRYLWRHLTPEKRAEMMDWVLAARPAAGATQ